MNYPCYQHIIYKILCKWTFQTCFSGEQLKAPWASCSRVLRTCWYANIYIPKHKNAKFYSH